MHIGLASKNPTKVEAVRTAATNVLWGKKAEFSYAKIPSGVDDQPMNIEDTHLGAKNRAETLLEVNPAVDVAVGLEGGIVEVNGHFIDIGVAYVLGRTGIYGIALSQGHEVPEDVMELIHQDKEMSTAVEELYGTNTVNDRDCSGVITGGYLTAAEFYRQPTELALNDYLRKATEAALKEV
jgi:inosine/xanthosine triphosphatase